MYQFLRKSVIVLATGLFFSATAVKAQYFPHPTHVIVLIEENYAYSQIIGSSAASYAPYLNALVADSNCASFSEAYALEHPSQPNYLDFFSGQNQGIYDDYVPTTYPFTTCNLGASLIAASKTFVTYSEDLPYPNYDGATYTLGSANYARKHNPAANWVGTGSNQFSGTVVNLPYQGYFPGSASGSGNFSDLPTVSYVVPNMTNDMHDGSGPANITLGDKWFHDSLSTLMTWVMDNDALLIITFDEDDDAHLNHIPTLFYGPMVRGGTYSRQITLLSMLKTIEQMYGLPSCANEADSSAISFCWKIPTAIKNIAEMPQHNIYAGPNPAKNFIAFADEKIGNSMLTIAVKDELGRQLGDYTMNEKTLDISTDNFNNGLYFYTITNENGVILANGKFVVAK